MTKHVVAIVQLPPPVTGLSAVNQCMVEKLSHAGKLAAVVNMAPPDGATGLRKHLGRFARTLSAAGLLLRLRVKGVTTVYMPSDGGAGMIWNIALLLVARAMRHRVWVHHHSFAYVNRRSALMALQLAVAPVGTRHLVLCQAMLDGLKANYSKVWARGRQVGLLLPNSFMPDSRPGSAVASETFIIGHLANLTAAKGALRFISLFRLARAEGLNIKARIAGPVSDELSGEAIRQVVADFPDSFEWLGPIYGEAKTQFYQSIDAFAFPSDYENEAQPLVLLEALSEGAALLVTKRGCMGCDHVNAPGLTADVKEFEVSALQWLREHEHPVARKRLKQQAKQRFSEAKAEGQAALSRIMEAI